MRHQERWGGIGITLVLVLQEPGPFGRCPSVVPVGVFVVGGLLLVQRLVDGDRQFDE